VDFLIAREDLHSTRFRDPSPPELEPGQALLNVERFGLTANNITYAVFGEAMSYWSFFPAEDGWGRMPVWGFARVSASREPRLAEGTRLYGYLPPSSELLITPAQISERGLVEGAAHRAKLPAAYNWYARTDADPVYEADYEELQMLLRPLFFTSFLLDDFLAEADFFGASAVLLSSASSRTASALAFLLSQRGAVEVVGLTSERSLPFVRALGVYDHALHYGELEQQLPDGRAVYVDISGDATVRSAVHERFREQLAHSAVVGATHHEQMLTAAPPLPGPHPTFFFAPDRIAKRGEDWGAEALAQRIAESWHAYVRWADGWLQVAAGEGPQELQRAYLDVLDGRVDPAHAHVLSLPRQ
jgi:Protein of unknown function (DUF2855)